MDLMGFLKEDPIHRQLYYGKLGNRKLKDKYTLYDLWSWFVLSTTTEQQRFSSAEETEYFKEQLLNDTRAFEEQELKWLGVYLEKYGLQTILYAIDVLGDNEETDLDLHLGLPRVQELAECIHTAQVYLSKVIREREVIRGDNV